MCGAVTMAHFVASPETKWSAQVKALGAKSTRDAFLWALTDAITGAQQLLCAKLVPQSDLTMENLCLVVKERSPCGRFALDWYVALNMPVCLQPGRDTDSSECSGTFAADSAAMRNSAASKTKQSFAAIIAAMVMSGRKSSSW